MAVYRVAKPSEYLAVTGWGIEEIQITKKAWIFFGQSYTVLDLTPVIHTFEVQAMSAEKLPFILPVIFTIGPHNHKKSLIKYAKLMSPHDKPSNHIRELVKGVIEGETRVLAASMIMEQIFKGSNEFKQQVLDKVQQELKKFGLLIYNAYVNQLINVPGHKYFSYLGQKTQMEEVNQETIDVMEAKKKSEIGLKEELYVCSDAKISENKRETEIVDANADLATEMEKTAEVEVAKAETIQEVQEANSQLHQKEKVAKTESYEQANVADSIMRLSNATVEALMKRSDAMADSIMKRSDVMAEALTKRSDAIHFALDGWEEIAEVQRECMWNNDHLF